MFRLFGFILMCMLLQPSAFAQSSMLSYLGNSGKEGFYDVHELNDGTVVVGGYCENLQWVNSNIPITELTITEEIPNAQGSNRHGILLHFSARFTSLLHVVAFPMGVVEDVRFVKSNGTAGNLWVSCTTRDSENNDGGYVLAKLNNDFVSGIPTALEWARPVWAEGWIQEAQPWDVDGVGRLYYVSGQAHDYDWSAVYCLDTQGERIVVEGWRTHWLESGGEWRGTPASEAPLEVNYSGIVLKAWGRCELRSWTQEEYDAWQSDGNGGTKKGKWPADLLFGGPCDPQNPTAEGQGYTGYSLESCCPVYGATSIVCDRQSNRLFIGMNFKSYAHLPGGGGSPDFEPAVIAFDENGAMMWWTRLYHEVNPQGEPMISLPDQYVDALAFDATNDRLVVVARSHGNGVENLWEGNEISANPTALGFQNRFTGTAGDIHGSWIGTFSATDGSLLHSTYMFELAEGTGGLGTPHEEPIMNGWPDLNTGWPNLNTTRIARNSLKVSAMGEPMLVAQGRRTATTANAHQKNVNPYFGGQGCWNSFVRVYESDLELPVYSSLVVGQWDTITQAGGGNTELFGVDRTADGIYIVGTHRADASGLALGESIPISNVPEWARSFPEAESGIIGFFTAPELLSPSDSPVGLTEPVTANTLKIFPNPSVDFIRLNQAATLNDAEAPRVQDSYGRQVKVDFDPSGNADIRRLPAGMYVVSYNGAMCRFVVIR